MMDDSEHDETFEDAEGSGDDEQPKKTRKTAGGRVIIKSKEGESYKTLHELFCVLTGVDSMDADMLRDDLTPLVMGALRSNGTDPDAIRAAGELSVVPFGVDTKGMIQGQGGSIHTLITISHTNHVVMAAVEHVTKDGGVSVLGATIVAEPYVAAAARAQASFGRAEEVAREQKKAGTYVIVRGIGAIDDANLDAHADAMAAAFGATTTSIMRENVRDEGDNIISDTSSGGIRFHVALDRHEITVPERYTYQVATKDGTPRVCILNRYSNIFVCDDDYKRCCGRIIIPQHREHAPTCHTRGYVSAFPKNKSKTTVRGPPDQHNPRAGEFFLPPEAKEQRTRYAKAVLKACAHAVVGGKMNGRKAELELCKAWSASRKRRQIYATAELRPGMVCEERCRQFPCVAVVLKRPEEEQARAAEWPGPVAGMAGMSM